MKQEDPNINVYFILSQRAQMYAEDKKTLHRLLLGLMCNA